VRVWCCVVVGTTVNSRVDRTAKIGGRLTRENRGIRDVSKTATQHTTDTTTPANKRDRRR
jgi:hypothetical protein